MIFINLNSQFINPNNDRFISNNDTITFGFKKIINPKEQALTIDF